MAEQDENDRLAHDLKSALNAVGYFIRLAKNGEDFSSKDGAETVIRVEEALQTLKAFVHEKTKDAQGAN